MAEQRCPIRCSWSLQLLFPGNKEKEMHAGPQLEAVPQASLANLGFFLNRVKLLRWCPLSGEVLGMRGALARSLRGPQLSWAPISSQPPFAARALRSWPQSQQCTQIAYQQGGLGESLEPLGSCPSSLPLSQSQLGRGVQCLGSPKVLAEGL